MRFWFSAGISKWTTGFIFIFLPPDILRINERWWVEAAVVGPAVVSVVRVHYSEPPRGEARVCCGRPEYRASMGSPGAPQPVEARGSHSPPVRVGRAWGGGQVRMT